MVRRWAFPPWGDRQSAKDRSREGLSPHIPEGRRRATDSTASMNEVPGRTVGC
jgi:hypothetical protein